jgi:hypothetical protein
VADRDHELLADLLQPDVPALGERHPQAENRAAIVPVQLVSQLGVEDVGRPAVGEELIAEPVEHLGPDHLLLEVARRQHRHRREALGDELQVLALPP